MKKLKSLSKDELKKIKAGGDGWPYEGAPCYCNGVFMGYPSTAQGCMYICDPKPNLPGLPSESVD